MIRIDAILSPVIKEVSTALGENIHQQLQCAIMTAALLHQQVETVLDG